MQRKIAIVQGHPDPSKERFGRALQEAYAAGATGAGHQVRVIDVATLDFPLLRTKHDWEKGEPPASIREAQLAIQWAEHLVIFYPLWAGSMPALLKAFFEQAFRPGFAMDPAGGRGGRKRLAGRSARVIVTMGMPALVYRWFFRAHSLKSLERNILSFCGIGPVKTSLVGQVDDTNPARRVKWLAKMREYGAHADVGYL